MIPGGLNDESRKTGLDRFHLSFNDLGCQENLVSDIERNEDDQPDLPMGMGDGDGPDIGAGMAASAAARLTA